MTDAPKQRRGFACMDKTRLVELCRKGGASVPADRRSYSQNRALASESGRKGGKLVPPESRSFSNPILASEAGRRGGREAQRRKRLLKAGEPPCA